MKLSYLIGAVFAIPGVAIVFGCVRDLAHCNAWMITAACVMIAVGCTIFDNAPVISAFKALVGIAAPYIPTGGRRRDDPPDRPVG